MRLYIIAIVVLVSFKVFYVKSQDMIVDLSGLNLSKLPDSLFDIAEHVINLNLGSTGGIHVLTNPEIRPLSFGTGTRNRFKELSPAIGLLKELKVIDLSFNDLQDLPREFYLLPIEELHLNFNYRFKIDSESAKLSKLKSLKNLFLIGVKFKSFPEKLLSLDLERLAVGNFSLRVNNDFVETISGFKNLKELYLFDVDMDFLPSNFDALQSLETLDIRYSPTKNIRGAAEGLKKLKYLKRLNLYSLPLTLDDVNFLQSALEGVEIDFMSKD